MNILDKGGFKGSKVSRHIAGIVPVAGPKLDFQTEWPDCLMPIGKDFTIIERAVLECAHAGCKSIWIIASDEISILVKRRIGEWIANPKTLGRLYDEFNVPVRIPIFYIPLNPQDSFRRDSFGWSIIFGALRAIEICETITRWVVPYRFYVAFPFSVYPFGSIIRYRHLIRGRNNFFLSWRGKTVKDGEYLPFTFREYDLMHMVREFRTLEQELKKKWAELPQNERPMGMKSAGRTLTLKQLFGDLPIKNHKKASGTDIREVRWFYRIDSWSTYCDYLGSRESRRIVRASKLMLRKWDSFYEDGKWTTLGDPIEQPPEGVEEQ